MHAAFPTVFSFEQSTYAGAADELMRPGAAGPFVQPWYMPISCTPADTGMPMGGIGSAFTLRKFHDAFLAEGAIPLPLVEKALLR